MTVPYRWPRLIAQSSIPITTGGAAGAGHSARRNTRRIVSAADGHAQTRSQASCRRSAQGVVQRAEGFIHPPPAAMPRRRQRIWLLSECSLGAARVDAFEPANLDANQDTLAKTRLIGELASVATMSARTGLRTARTRRRAHRGSRVHPEVAGPVVPSFDTLASRVQQRRQPRNASHSAFAL